jgi:hypothetical protein
MLENNMGKRNAMLAALASALLLGGLTPALGHSGDSPGGMIGPGQIMLHCYAVNPGMGMMGPGYGMSPGQGQGYGMGPGMMGHGYGMNPDQGQGYGMGPGMMGHGYGMNPDQGQGYGMGPGMMGHGYGMSPGQGQGYGMGPGMMQGRAALPDRDLSADDVRKNLEQQLAWRGNPRLKLGDINEVDEDTITAEIVTKDGSLVDKLAIDRHTGMMRQVPE